jgi:hypothetical protein
MHSLPSLRSRPPSLLRTGDGVARLVVGDDALLFGRDELVTLQTRDDALRSQLEREGKEGGREGGSGLSEWYRGMLRQEKCVFMRLKKSKG